jgi:membrane fusion protein, multidrug efflux system
MDDRPAPVTEDPATPRHDPLGERRDDHGLPLHSGQVDAASGREKPEQERPRSRPRRRLLLMLAVIVVIALTVAGYIWWQYARQFETTDDAFIDTRIVTISPQIAGAIVDVPVDDNQFVDAGAVLARIDERNYRAAFDQAKAQVDQAQATIDNLKAQVAAQQAKIDQAAKQVTEAQGALDFSQQENTRYQGLLRTGSGSEQRAQQAASDLIQKQAAVGSAQANLEVADRQIEVLKTQQEEAQAQLEQAKANQDLAAANLDRTVIRAPVAGRVTKLTAARGEYAVAGQAVMMFVPRDLWITANFKETQLDTMRPGQPVDVSIDAYPGRVFRAHVDSIQEGSGTVFSLLPAENATGNYVKVVQRVPVKIVFDHPPDVYLGPGMSVVPTVKVR